MRPISYLPFPHPSIKRDAPAKTEEPFYCFKKAASKGVRLVSPAFETAPQFIDYSAEPSEALSPSTTSTISSIEVALPASGAKSSATTA